MWDNVGGTMAIDDDNKYHKNAINTHKSWQQWTDYHTHKTGAASEWKIWFQKN